MSSPYSSKELAATFFEESGSKEDGSKIITIFKCQCGTTRLQNLKKGYVNLVSHIKDQHPDWKEIMDSKKIDKEENRNPFINRKASRYYSVKRNVTRWSSTFTMLRRFFELKPFLDESDEILVSYLPSGTECLKLQKLLEDLTEWESITLQLQDSKINMSDVRSIFDLCIESNPSWNYYLAPDSKIIHCPDFESAIVKVIDGNTAELSGRELRTVLQFTTEERNTSVADTDGMTLAQKVREVKHRKRKRDLSVETHHLIDLEFIHSTSNVVERLFSSAKLVLTDYRKSMTPYTFECVMFLKYSSLWDINSVSKIVGK